jgi:CheY-like chemotaxis protein
MTEQYSFDEQNHYLSLINQNKRCLACKSIEILTVYEHREHKRLTKFFCTKCDWSFTYLPSQRKDAYLMSSRFELPIVCLLVEDNSVDLGYIFRAISKAKLNLLIQWVENGIEAMYYLIGFGQYANRKCYPLPDAIVSDNNLPDMSGTELLQWVRQQENVKDIPFLIVGHSNLETDIKETTDLGATYYAKSTFIDDYILMLKNLYAIVTN